MRRFNLKRWQQHQQVGFKKPAPEKQHIESDCNSPALTAIHINVYWIDKYLEVHSCTTWGHSSCSQVPDPISATSCVLQTRTRSVQQHNPAPQTA